MTRYHRFTTPLGIVFATAVGGALTGVYFEGQRHAPAIDKRWTRDPKSEPLIACERQLLEYFAGLRKRFELVLAPEGTPFQQRVWREIAGIPYGEVITYAELARRAGSPQSARAAGAATGRNPISIVVPCHRVLGSSGALTGYAGGLERKESLLALESGAHAQAA
jgi:methylated-DNA-[protein]-cysteine S-methyltransferase